MKARISSTDRIVEIDNVGGIGTTQARVWEGVSNGGVPFTAYIPLVMVNRQDDNGDFERELIEHAPLSVRTLHAIEQVRADAPATQEQPPPVANDGPACWDLVLADMAARDALGRARYGTPLQPHNGRDALADAYAEALDLAVYLRQALFERDGR